MQIRQRGISYRPFRYLRPRQRGKRYKTQKMVNLGGGEGEERGALNARELQILFLLPHLSCQNFKGSVLTTMPPKRRVRALAGFRDEE